MDGSVRPVRADLSVSDLAGGHMMAQLRKLRKVNLARF